MGVLRRFFRRLAGLAGAAAIVIMGGVCYYQNEIPDSFYVTQGRSLTLPNMDLLRGAELLDYGRTSLANESIGASRSLELRLFGIIPVKTTRVSVISQQQVTPGGTAFGIKLFTKGVIVVDLNTIPTRNGGVCPAKEAGLEKGDVILSINGQGVNSNEEVSALIAGSGGRTLTLRFLRGGAEKTALLTPAAASEDGVYRGGLWVRDSSAGIGTVTYYDEETGAFAGLGHGICDVDTGEIMPLNTGEVCPVHINSILRGRTGAPGELRGSFASTQASGSLLLNNEAGIFGVLNQRPNNLTRLPVTLKQDVHTGPASILCTLDDGGIREYAVSIDRVDLNPETLTKNMMLTVTDPALLAKTGGIVQGMSGSPILQDGCLIGAVTHVFVNNPAKGYGIFAENMLKYSDELVS